MIRRHGAQRWENVHVTHAADLADLIDIDNSSASGPQKTGFALLRQAASEIDQLAREARQHGVKLRALGSGWALTDIAITNGWLLNTKLLNGCFDLAPPMFESAYPESKRPFLVLAQCGISIGELNVHLEITATPGFRRSLKTAGIGAGQTIAGAISGNTHGAAINFGSTPDFVAGLQIVTGSGRSVWIERASNPVLNDEFLQKLDADRIRDDDIFNGALVSFGAYGIITAVAIETAPIYELDFKPVRNVPYEELAARLNHFDFNDPAELYHYEFIFDPYNEKRQAMEALATKVPWVIDHEAPKPVWIVRSDQGFALGDDVGAAFLAAPLPPPGLKTALQFKQYRERCLLGNIRATPGQLFTATITYYKGNTESAIGVSIHDAARMMAISMEVIKSLGLPAMSQVRVVHPTSALLGFTQLQPKTAVFDFGLANNRDFPRFEQKLTEALTANGIAHAFHWSKNSGLAKDQILKMYGEGRVTRWRDARRKLFNGDTALMQVFENPHLVRAGLV